MQLQILKFGLILEKL